jgi:hypothetical protein
MIGLSLQDTNLQDLFAAARRENAWPWPPAPPPQGHVFCADSIGTHQSNMLRVVYGAAYGQNRAAIEESALIRAYAKPILVGLVLQVLCAKLSSLATQRCGARLADASADIGAGLRHLRDSVAALADASMRERQCGQREPRNGAAQITKTAAEAAQTSAKAASEQVRVMIAMESPVFSFAGFEMEQVSGISMSGINAAVNYYPTVIVRNVGRSHMELRAFSIDTVVGEGFPIQAQFPATPEYKHLIEPGLIIEALKEARLQTPETIKFTEDEAKSLQDGTRPFWIYGFVRYFSQFTGEIGDVGFMRIYTRRGFAPLGLPNYNYHRHHKVNGGDVPLPWKTISTTS